MIKKKINKQTSKKKKNYVSDCADHYFSLFLFFLSPIYYGDLKKKKKIVNLTTVVLIIVMKTRIVLGFIFIHNYSGNEKEKIINSH